MPIMLDGKTVMTSPDRCYYIQRDGHTIEINLNKCEMGIDIGLDLDTNEEVGLNPAEILLAQLYEESSYD